LHSGVQKTRFRSKILELADKCIPIFVGEFHGALHQYLWIPVIGPWIDLGFGIVLDFSRAIRGLVLEWA